MSKSEAHIILSLPNMFAGKFGCVTPIAWSGYLTCECGKLPCMPGLNRANSGRIPYEKISNPERGNSYMLRQADWIGGNAGAWARGMLKNRGIPGIRVLNGLLQLADKYTATAIDKGCKTALEMNAFRLRELKEYIRNDYQTEQLKFEFLEEHPLIRQINEYGLC